MTALAAKVPGGNSRQVQLAEEEIAGSDGEGDSDPDPGDDGSSSVAADGETSGSRPASQSLPRSYRLPQAVANNGSSVLAAEVAYSARKVDSLPGVLRKRTTPSAAGDSLSPGSSSLTAASDDAAGKKRTTGRLLKSFGQFVQKVARQLTSLNVSSFGNINGNSNGSRSKTPTRQNDSRNCEGGQAGDGQINRLSRGDADGSSALPLGVVGIQNHGNTCFMNAVLQCLANTEQLASYLVTERYRADIRRCTRRGSNLRPGSTRGELTESFATLVKALWRRTMTSDVSSEFRAMVARHGAQYRGCSQHDAQEFLLWLLDQVHEDVNIATKKKYRANKSSIGRPDEAVAAEALANHTRCNNSFIYDLFQALYRSSLTCPSCHHRSNTFDPFLSVSLPIPHKSLQPNYVTIIRSTSAPCDGVVAQHIRMGFLVDPEETVSELRRVVADGAKLAEDSLVLVEIDANGFHQTLSDSNFLFELGENPDLYAVEVERHQQQSPSDVVTAILLNKDQHSGLWFGPLLPVRLTRDSRSTEMQLAIMDALARYCQVTFPPEMDGLLLLRLANSSTTPTVNLLAADTEFPLRTDAVIRALNFQTHGTGPLHLQLVAEWNSSTKERIDSSPITDYTVEHESVQQVKNAPQQSQLSTLDECFQIYTKDERLGADDAWLCPNCHKYQQDTVKALGLWSLPEILVIHLKRFKQDASQRYKLNTLVMFPTKGLDMSRHVQKSTSTPANGHSWSDGNAAGVGGVGGGVQRHGSTSPNSRNSSTSSMSTWLAWKPGRKVPDLANDYMYDLYAVCNHYGNMQGGHYTAFCKNAANGRWYSFNDSKALEMREEEVVTRAAYLLFYQRRSSTVNGDVNARREWLQQLQSSTVNGMPRTVTSHSLDNLLDSEGSTSSSQVTEEALQRHVELYATIRKPADRSSGLGIMTDSAPIVDIAAETDDDVFPAAVSKDGIGHMVNGGVHDMSAESTVKATISKQSGILSGSTEKISLAKQNGELVVSTEKLSAFKPSGALSGAAETGTAAKETVVLSGSTAKATAAKKSEVLSASAEKTDAGKKTDELKGSEVSLGSTEKVSSAKHIAVSSGSTEKLSATKQVAPSGSIEKLSATKQVTAPEKLSSTKPVAVSSISTSKVSSVKPVAASSPIPHTATNNSLTASAGSTYSTANGFHGKSSTNEQRAKMSEKVPDGPGSKT